MRASPRADAQFRARVHTIGRQLRRFRPEIRQAVVALARRHVRLAELSVSFPALLAALAWPRHGFDPRAVVAGAIAGAPLDALAAQARVPLWLRRMEPALVIAPLPVLPDSPFIRQRMVNQFPRHPRHAALWFEAVSEGGLWAHEGFALWAAEAYAARRKPTKRRPKFHIRLLALWAWYSEQPGTRGHALIETPWQPQISFDGACKAALTWRDNLDLEFYLGTQGARDPWHAPAHIDGYDFVPLTGADAVADEARAMDNCLRGYGEAVAQIYSRLWSVRKDGTRVATLEMSRDGADPRPSIRELCLKRNTPAPRELWLTVYKWLDGQGTKLFDEPAPDCTAPPGRAAWQALWKPYWHAKGRIPPFLPLVPNRDTLFDL